MRRRIECSENRREKIKYSRFPRLEKKSPTPYRNYANVFNNGDVVCATRLSFVSTSRPNNAGNSSHSSIRIYFTLTLHCLTYIFKNHVKQIA